MKRDPENLTGSLFQIDAFLEQPDDTLALIGVLLPCERLRNIVVQLLLGLIPQFCDGNSLELFIV